ncbi:MAG: hypothetical protein AVDCRST_MAG65-876, partial [uncultured Solirubrobacteraceae bacterium]
ATQSTTASVIAGGVAGTALNRATSARPAAVTDPRGSSPSSATAASRIAGIARRRRRARVKTSRRPSAPAAARSQVATSTSRAARVARRAASSVPRSASQAAPKAVAASSAVSASPRRRGWESGRLVTVANASQSATAPSSGHDGGVSSRTKAMAAATATARASKRPGGEAGGSATSSWASGCAWAGQPFSARRYTTTWMAL